MTETIVLSKTLISLDFEEGQQVTLLRGAKVNGLTTKCNQPGKIIHIQYSDEFGLTYVVAFGSLGMYAYVGADGLEAVAAVEEVAPVTPLLDLYPGVDAADLLTPALDPTDTMELVSIGDLVQWGYSLAVEPREGKVKRIYKGVYLVEFQFGTQRWCFADEIRLILKAVAQETKPLASSVEVSGS